MGLAVWYPLNNNTTGVRNCGYNATSSLSPGNITGGGQLGSCYKGPETRTLTDPISSLHFSVCFWVKPVAPSADWPAFLILNATVGGNAFFYITTVNYNRYKIEGPCNYGILNPLNEWVHFAYVFNNGVCKGYVNGKYDRQISTTYTSGNITGFTLGNATRALLNDFRLYDHCLSDKEVEIISRGLVCHFPLNLVERNLNLLPDLTVGYSRYSVTVNKTGVSAVTLSSDIAIDSGCTGTNLRMTCGVKYSDNTLTLVMGYTLTNCPKDGLYRHYEVIVTTDPSKTISQIYGWVVDHSDIGNLSSTSHIRNVCLTLGCNPGQVYTPYYAGTTTWVSNTEYDTSGFQNNGTWNTLPEWSSESPRFNGSYLLNANKLAVSSNPLKDIGASVCSLAAWVKPSQYSTNGIVIQGGIYMGINGSGKLTSYAYGKSNGYTYSNTTIPLNAWTHIAVVWTESQVLLYVNGQLDKSANCTGLFTNSYFSLLNIGHNADTYLYYGLMSDVRIYATALSQDQIRELYETSAIVTN